MAECPSFLTCPFYNDKMADKPGMTGVYKKRYCEGDNSLCARWKVSLTVGKEKVPSDLYPNMMDRAEKIIAEI